MPPIDSSFSLSTISIPDGKISLGFLQFSSDFLMVPELEKPKVLEIQLRMDCNGCVQKIKKALHGINGIYDLYIDFPQQKLTIIGWADPERIMKAIKKTRKIATICSHSEATDPSQQPQEGGGGGPPPEAANPPPPPPEGGGPPPEAAQPPKPPNEQQPPPPPENPPPPTGNPPPPQNPPPDVTPSPIAAETNANQQAGPSGPKDIGEVHVIHHHPPNYAYRYGYAPSYSGSWNRYTNDQGLQQVAPQGPQPIYVTHSYNTYRPSPYVTEYEYVRSPPRYAHYSQLNHYNEDYHSNNGYHNNNGNITSIFSDENPNACRIM
ncbi:extensin-like [Mangifera indica]|uniref:extensin-like n=1 Tax=Mangifera indica TaxID=29780 RepID=UPI001CF9BFF5|nr:extensin-like [Mangifera indica]